MDQILGEIRMFAGRRPPQGWLFCIGQLLPLSDYQALYSLLGTRFGGNGVSNFALPDLRGRIPVGIGQKPGMATKYFIGNKVGSEAVTLSNAQFPAHKHTLVCNSKAGEGMQNNPGATYMGVGPVNAATTVPVNTRYAATSSGNTMATGAISSAGSSAPFSVIQPILTINFMIATIGEYPVRPN